MEEIYCIDTSFFIESWNNYYRKSFFSKKDFFERLLEKCQGHKIFIHEQVYRETNEQDDDVNKWMKKNKDQFHTLDEIGEEVVGLSKEILKEHFGDKDKYANTADIFIISAAKVLNNEGQFKGVVVSNEKRRGGAKIPNVCDEEGIEHLSIFDFIEKVGIKLDSK